MIYNKLAIVALSRERIFPYEIGYSEADPWLYDLPTDVEVTVE